MLTQVSTPGRLLRTYSPSMAPRDQPIDHTMSFGDHLEELRRRILYALALPVPAAIVMFFFSNTLIQWLLLPLFEVLRDEGLQPHVLQLSPPEAIVTQIKLSIIAALIISGPWVLWQAWRFIGPGLYRHERRFVRFLVPGSVILTSIAVAMTYWVFLPLMLRVLVAIGMSMGAAGPTPSIDARAEEILKANPPMVIYESPPMNPKAGDVWLLWPDWKRSIAVPNASGGIDIIDAPHAGRGVVTQDFRLSEYVSFTLLFMLGTVVAFQMPLVVVLLGWVGVASPLWLRQNRKYALFICAIAAAMITPSADMISMFVLLVPLYGLYELGIFLLILAPASHVAEGRIIDWRRWRRQGSDKRPAQSDHPDKSAQPDLTAARRGRSGESPPRHADGGEDVP
jgi:sec-independent protein translocase protein TatC